MYWGVTLNTFFKPYALWRGGEYRKFALRADWGGGGGEEADRGGVGGMIHFERKEICNHGRASTRI